MIPLERAVVARLESHGEKFELLVDPDLAVRYRQGEAIAIEDMVAALSVFENSSRGTRASDEALTRVFSTTDFPAVADKIIRKGEIHLTAEQRRHIIAEKKKKVITFIARNAINPQTNLPHPPQRIEMAMDEARVNIDLYKNTEELVKETVKALRPILPIKFEEVRIAVKIPPDFASKAYGEIQAAAQMEKEEWQRDGSWICVVRIPAGIQGEFYDLINRVTRGQGEVRILNQVY
ncbi:MAG TPA: ribosome assembly factor SBDS [Methanoregulaceae archaeon]|nr:MAG: ribosome assembly factor SBDS [Methanolinea sp.]HON82331.1 ribosome assembly factor SBDS [Methanoregulaceae archaeon]HPD11130.1 ribosome assembly factor SBDS [Methanoregulaceae archaeon]HRT16164.1 ribosome assembly factor SBDS [Methanoregulaceae archaeon]HRU31717.1 ribosome assembly factor SBDS [Methanoregulaceae archaeon]